DGQKVKIPEGIVKCAEFPVVVITSNGERDLPPAFLRRCLQVDLPKPDIETLRDIVLKHLPIDKEPDLTDLLKVFDEKRDKGMLATDQLLNAFFLVTRGRTFSAEDRKAIERIVLR